MKPTQYLNWHGNDEFELEYDTDNLIAYVICDGEPDAQQVYSRMLREWQHGVCNVEFYFFPMGSDFVSREAEEYVNKYTTTKHWSNFLVYFAINNWTIKLITGGNKMPYISNENTEEIQMEHMVIEVEAQDLIHVLNTINSQIETCFTITPLTNKYRIEFDY